MKLYIEENNNYNPPAVEVVCRDFNSFEFSIRYLEDFIEYNYFEFNEKDGEVFRTVYERWH